jgi:N-acyl-D-aspartate/D-glutamate deacylase
MRRGTPSATRRGAAEGLIGGIQRPGAGPPLRTPKSVHSYLGREAADSTGVGIREGADADLTIFDPATVVDAATYEDPTLSSAGIPWVVVGGQVVGGHRRTARGSDPGAGALRGGAEG